MITVDDDFVRHRVLASAAVLQAFPTFNAYRTQLQTLDKDCGTCSGAADARAKRADLNNEIRSTLSGLTPDQWQVIRTALNLPRLPILVAYRVNRSGVHKIETKVIKLN